ncbi:MULTISPECIES: tetratricopeptide repeat protein [Pseudanabaena]|uniref:Tetratricopeptide TPR_1 repeat-containing protein n=2 Tax=Pseudanabaena TaxID=1152 RepID=L8N633_9CYAN|nr:MULTISPECIES: tetratricopeptide repeat protein [Pseudanabaena]ELS34165.1 Tetratricopeptide TPR_1 repeat-containing protein [Pseudanabaena biceps PCC 7429]MDG3493638.1 tetratricopeptide repeat protein [Pseudanabaena catenata USMAC16]
MKSLHILVALALTSIYLFGKVPKVIAKSNPQANHSSSSQAKLLITQANFAYQSELNSLVQAGDEKLNQKKFQEAISIYQKALQLANQNQDQESQVAVLVGIGRIYDQSGKYLDAERSFNSGLQILSQLAGEPASVEKRVMQSRLRVLSLTGSGIVYTNLGNYDKASKQLELAVAISNEGINSPSLLVQFEPRFKLAELYEKQNKYSEAIGVLQYCRIIATQIGDRQAEAMTLTAIGNNLTKLGNLSVAKQYYDQAKTLGNFPQEPEIANAPSRLEAVSGDLVGLTNLLDRFAPILQKASVSIRKIERILSIDPSFAIVGKAANNLDQVIQNLANATPKLRSGDLIGAYPSLQKINGGMSEMLQNLKELQGLMEDVQQNPKKFPVLQRLSPQDLMDLNNINVEMRDITNSIGGKSKSKKN